MKNFFEKIFDNENKDVAQKKNALNNLQRLIVVLGSLIPALVSSYLYMTGYARKVYRDGEAVLSELITGTSVFKDYYKPADFMIPRHFMLSFLGFFFVYYVIAYLLVRYKKSLSASYYAVTFITGFVMLKQFFGYDMKMEWLLLAAVWGIHILDIIKKLYARGKFPTVLDNTDIASNSTADLHKTHETTAVQVTALDRDQAQNRILNQAVLSVLLAFFGARVFVQMFLNFGIVSDSGAAKGFYLIFILAVLALAFVFCFGDRFRAFSLNKLYLEGVQLLLLCFLPALFVFRTNYNGVVETFSYTGIRILAVVAFLGIVFYQWRNRSRIFGQVHPYSLMIIAAMQIPVEIPVDGLVSVNLFHYGELTVPFTQMISYHKLPYLDFFPIHGICDYFFATVNAFLLDGTYASFFIAYAIGSMILLALCAYVVYKCVGQELLQVFLVSFFMTIGEWYYYFRFILVLPIILIFFKKSIRENAYKSLIAYIVTSIISIAWYPAIGGSLALALLLPLCMRVFTKNGILQIKAVFQKENRKKYLPSLILTLIFGISFVPMFFGILRFLKENMGISGYFPGDSLYDVLVSGGSHGVFRIPDIFSDVAYRGFFFMAAVILIVALVCYYRRAAYLQMLFAVLIFCYMICSYTFGSIFAGERAAIVNVVLLLAIIYVFVEENKESRVLPAFLLGAALVINCNDFSQTQADAISVQNISDQFVRLDGEELSCKKMGTVVVPSAIADQIRDTAFVINAFCADDETYLDFTNRSAFYMMFDKETPFAYCALYHGTSDATRAAMLESLQENLPKLVLVSPYWNSDGGSISLRYKDIYQLVLSKGYQPYQYGSVCFLLAPDVEVPDWAEDGSRTFYEAMTTESLQALPLVWGRSAKEEDFSVVDAGCEVLASEDVVTEDQESYTVTGERPAVVLHFYGDDISSEAEYLRLHISGLASSDTESADSGDFADASASKVNVKMYFSYPDEPVYEEFSLSCVVEDGDLLIPLYSYPMWNMFQMTTIRMEFDGEDLVGQTFSMDYELWKENK